MAKRDAITAEYVRSILHYNPQTGEFRWKARADVRCEWNTRYAGSTAGTLGFNGYYSIHIGKYKYYSHHLSWLYMTGEWPEHEIDHRDTDKTNNKWENLREADSSQNKCNTMRRKDNTSGHKGISFDKKTRKWRAQISIDKKYHNLGFFDNLEESISAYSSAAHELHGKFARIK